MSQGGFSKQGLESWMVETRVTKDEARTQPVFHTPTLSLQKERQSEWVKMPVSRFFVLLFLIHSIDTSTITQCSIGKCGVNRLCASKKGRSLLCVCVFFLYSDRFGLGTLIEKIHFVDVYTELKFTFRHRITHIYIYTLSKWNILLCTNKITFYIIYIIECALVRWKDADFHFHSSIARGVPLENPFPFRALSTLHSLYPHPLILLHTFSRHCIHKPRASLPSHASLFALLYNFPAFLRHARIDLRDVCFSNPKPTLRLPLSLKQLSAQRQRVSLIKISCGTFKLIPASLLRPPSNAPFSISFQTNHAKRFGRKMCNINTRRR